MALIPAAVRRLDAELPHFPDGRIDYRGAPVAAVLTCFVEWSRKILLLKRSDRVGTYPGLWSTVTGYLDEPKPTEDKARAELLEELGIELNSNASIKCGEPYEFQDDLLKRTWIVHPVLISLQEQPSISLDWEHTELVWITPGEISKFDCVPNLARSLWQVWP